MRKIYLTLFVLCSDVYGITFEEAIKKLKNHESIVMVRNIVQETESEAKLKSSWGDPKLKIMAKNYPMDTFRNNETPMTGLEISINQNIPLSNKYSVREEALLKYAQAIKYKSIDRENLLLKSFWDTLVARTKVKLELDIYRENLAWINKILKVSKKLYGTGKITQQAILDIQIRKSNLESDISSKQIEISKSNDVLRYLISDDRVSDSELEDMKIPWNILSEVKTGIIDPKEEMFAKKLDSKELSLKAAKLNLIPDIGFSVGVTKRSNIDGKGDFISASLTIPMPFSDTRSSIESKSIHEKYTSQLELENYKKDKGKTVAILKKDILKIQKELEILGTKTIKFSKNSRDITAKSYGLGNSSYIELLQSELNLHNVQLKRVNLRSELKSKKINLKYITGDKLDA